MKNIAKKAAASVFTLAKKNVKDRFALVLSAPYAQERGDL